jgi:hypothetical protein
MTFYMKLTLFWIKMYSFCTIFYSILASKFRNQNILKAE